MTFLNEHLTRQLDLIPMDVLGEPITIIGAGAIGSWTALALAKMGFTQITVFDDDDVTTVNLNSQFFPRESVGAPKVKALSEMVEYFTGVNINAKHQRYTGGIFTGLVISAVDSMEARRLIWDSHKNKAPFTRAIIDPRMGAESALLYVSRPCLGVDIESYEKTLYSDAESVSERCTAKATIYTANMLAGLVCKAVKDELTSKTPLRSAQWSIAANEFLGFNRKASITL